MTESFDAVSEAVEDEFSTSSGSVVVVVLLELLMACLEELVLLLDELIILLLIGELSDCLVAIDTVSKSRSGS